MTNKNTKTIFKMKYDLIRDKIKRKTQLNMRQHLKNKIRFNYETKLKILKHN